MIRRAWSAVKKTIVFLLVFIGSRDSQKKHAKPLLGECWVQAGPLYLRFYERASSQIH